MMGSLRSRRIVFSEKSQVEVEESVVDSEWSGLGGRKDRGWRQEVSFTLEEIWEL